MRSKSKSSPALSLPIIVEQALALLDEVGFDGLSTRALASKLGIAGPSLYWHVKNKQTLLSHMAEAMFMANLPTPSKRKQSWQKWLKAGAICIRDAACSHRDGARVIAASHPTGSIDILSFPAMLKRLTDEGFSEDQARYAFLVMSRYTLGWVLAEQGEGDVGKHGPKKGYEFGLDTIVNGLELQLVNDAKTKGTNTKRKSITAKKT